MAHAGWLNENANRSYPFLKGQKSVPNDLIVDAGILFGYNSGYQEGIHSVWLSRISREGNTFSIEFETDAPGCLNQPLVFTRTIGPENVANFA